MGLLNFLKKEAPAEPTGVTRLPSGSYTIDSTGRVLVSTLPRSFPEPVARQISDLVLETFRRAQDVQMPLSELVVHYASLRLTAREMRGGAIIFLAPRTLEKK